ncbi:hypothetical protein KQ945_17770 [Bacillus subtilis subsp. subtilis]|nr:hypothetical protein [Bacillus subtilis subsp. subtilis]
MRLTAGKLLALIAASLLATTATAQQPVFTVPADEHRDVVMGWDRSTMPGNIELWAPRTVLAYDSSPALPYTATHLVCDSEVDASTGRCPTQGVEGAGDGSGEIWVQVTETRSGMRATVRATGSRIRPMSGPSCFSDLWGSIARPFWHADTDRCGRHQSAGIAVQLVVPASELEKLVAGKWRGTLKLFMYDQMVGSRLATYTFAFDFTVTDRDAVAIYLPAFEHATPNVDLDLRYDPFAHTIEGRKVVDMCLYDGLGSQSAYLGVTARDTGTRTPGPTGYSVWHDDGRNEDSRRVDYSVSLDHAGTRVPMPNGVEQRLTGIDAAQLRLVVLPGMTQPVFCVPTPLTLSTPRFGSSSKEAGHYSGSLQVELRVPTLTP